LLATDVPKLIEDLLVWYAGYDDNKEANDSSRMEWAILGIIKHRLLCIDGKEKEKEQTLFLKYGEVYQLSQTVHYARMAEDDCILDAKELKELETYLFNLQKKGDD